MSTLHSLVPLSKTLMSHATTARAQPEVLYAAGDARRLFAAV